MICTHSRIILLRLGLKAKICGLGLSFATKILCLAEPPLGLVSYGLVNITHKKLSKADRPAR